MPNVIKFLLFELYVGMLKPTQKQNDFVCVNMILIVFL